MFIAITGRHATIAPALRRYSGISFLLFQKAAKGYPQAAQRADAGRVN